MMKALNSLVARSILDPTIVQAFNGGRIAEVLGDFEFSPEMRTNLASLDANTFAEFAVLAYRVVKAAEAAETEIRLPSPLEGLVPTQAAADEEQAA
jgi:hypothetical protein